MCAATHACVSCARGWPHDTHARNTHPPHAHTTGFTCPGDVIVTDHKHASHAPASEPEPELSHLYLAELNSRGKETAAALAGSASGALYQVHGSLRARAVLLAVLLAGVWCAAVSQVSPELPSHTRLLARTCTRSEPHQLHLPATLRHAHPPSSSSSSSAAAAAAAAGQPSSGSGSRSRAAAQPLEHPQQQQQQRVGGRRQAVRGRGRSCRCRCRGGAAGARAHWQCGAWFWWRRRCSGRGRPPCAAVPAGRRQPAVGVCVRVQRVRAVRGRDARGRWRGL
jgi:hypothetical protein